MTNLEKAIQEGQSARRVRNAIESYIYDLEELTMDQLYQMYISHQLSDQMLRGAMGELIAYRKLRIALESDVRKGELAAEATVGDING